MLNDYLSIIYDFLNKPFGSAAFNAGASALLNGLITKWNNRKTKTKEDMKQILNEDYNDEQIKEIADEIKNASVHASQSNTGGINIVSGNNTTVIISKNTLEKNYELANNKPLEISNEDDIEREIKAEFRLFEMKTKTSPFPQQMTELINNEIEGPYRPVKVFATIQDIHAKYMVYPIINERLRIEEEVRKKYNSILPKDRFNQIKNDICGIADDYYKKAIDFSTHDTICHISKMVDSDYKIKEYEENAERLKQYKPTLLYNYIENKMTLIEIELKHHCKAKED